jgi:hypothetical protein
MPIDTYSEPLYARVNVSSLYYVWHQTLPAYHATLSVGYSNNGSTTMIGDPYTSSTNGCPEGIGYPGYSPNADYGCVYWGFSTNSYYRAVSGMVNGEDPEWF